MHLKKKMLVKNGKILYLAFELLEMASFVNYLILAL